MSIQLWIALVIGAAASAEDIVTRRISNWIPLAALLAGISWLGFDRGWRGALSAITGAIGGFFVFLIFYWLGGMGGGDVKLMAGLGAVVGIEKLLVAAWWTAACGGVLAALILTACTVRNLWIRKPAGSPAAQSIPYAPAIALGSLLALLPQS